MRVGIGTSLNQSELITVIVVDVADSQIHALFDQLKQLSRELLALVRISSLLPRSATNLPPLLARRIGLFIEKKQLEEAGILADFMANVVEASLEEKLRILSALDIKGRLQKVNELLARQVQGIKRTVKVTTITTSKCQSHCESHDAKLGFLRYSNPRLRTRHQQH